MSSHVPTTTLLRHAVLATAVLALVATPFASAAEAGITKPFKAKSTIQLAPGIKFQVGTMTTTGGRPQSVRVGRVDPRRDDVKLKALLSNDKVVKREVVTRITTAKSKPSFRPMIATTGDMSTRNRVDAYAAPQSMAVSGGELLLAQACERPMLGIDSDGTARIGQVRTHLSVVPPGKTMPKQIHRVNTHRDDGNVVLFTRRFASSTRTAYGGVEVILDLEGKLRPNGTQKVKVVKVRKNGGNTQLRWGQAVLSVKNPKQKWVYELKVGDRFELKTEVVRKVDKPCGGVIAQAAGWSDISEAQGGNHFTLRGLSLIHISEPTRRH